MKGVKKTWTCGDQDAFLGSVTLESAPKTERSSSGRRERSAPHVGDSVRKMKCEAVRGFCGGRSWMFGVQAEVGARKLSRDHTEYSEFTLDQSPLSLA